MRIYVGLTVLLLASAGQFVAANCMVGQVTSNCTVAHTNSSGTEANKTHSQETNRTKSSSKLINSNEQRSCQKVCGHLKKTRQMCHIFDKYCPRLSKVEASNEVDVVIQAITTAFNCTREQHLCPLKGGCLPKDRNCSISFSTAKDTKGTLGNQTANATMATSVKRDLITCPLVCKDGNVFCRAEMRCIKVGQTCLASRLHNLASGGQRESQQCGKKQIYCPVLDTCVQSLSECSPCSTGSAATLSTCLNRTGTCKETSNVTEKSTATQNCHFSCPLNETYCPSHSKCVPVAENCTTTAPFNGNVLSKYQHWHEFCVMRHHICARARILSQKCMHMPTKPEKLIEIQARETSNIPRRLTYIKGQKLLDLFKGSVIPKCIAVIGHDEKAVWNIFENNRKIEIKMDLSLNKALIIHITQRTMLWYRPKEPNGHGAASLKFVIPKECPKLPFVRVKNTKTWIGHLFVLMMPKVPVPGIEITKNRTDLEEDIERCVPIEVRKTIFIKKVTIDLTKKIPQSLLLQLSRHEVAKYLSYIEEIKTMKQRVVIVGCNADMIRDGRFYHRRKTVRGYSRWIIMPGRISLQKSYAVAMEDNICFMPRHDFSGIIHLKFATKVTTKRKVFRNGRLYIIMSSYTNSKPATHHILVRNLNDPPYFIRREAFLPPLPYKFDPKTYQGFRVSSLKLSRHECEDDMVSRRKKYFSHDEPLSFDPDGTEVGIAIIDCPMSKLGHYEFKIKNGKWMVCELTQSSEEVSHVLLLSPQARIRYIPTSSNTKMTIMETFQHGATLRFLAWDGSDRLPEGYHRMRVTFSRQGSYSREQAYGITLRRGCDGVCGSSKEIDVCGKCGGNGRSCLGCDNVPNSNATIDDCGMCTGGKTGIPYNKLKNCRGLCNNEYYKDKCGICQRRGHERKIEDCNGDCWGNAQMRCGRCVGGKTGKPLNYGQDICGICNGDNSTCLVCTAKMASDGKCSLKLTLQRSRLFLLHDKPVFQINGINMNRYSKADCFAYLISRPRVLIPLGKANISHAQASMQFSSQPMSLPSSFGYSLESGKLKEGVYGFQCKFDSHQKFHNVTGKVTIYQGELTTMEVKPSEVEYGKRVRLEVKGQGFRNITDLTCITDKLRNSKAVYISSQKVYCDVQSNQRKLESFKLSIGLHPHQFLTNTDSNVGVKIKVFCERPFVVAARFTKGYFRLRLFINKIWTPLQPRIKPSCSLFFDKRTIVRFGRRPRCYFNHRSPQHIDVRLGSGSTIKPGSHIQFDKKFITCTEGYAMKENPKATTNISIKDKNITTVARIFGPSVVALCKTENFVGSRSTGGGGKGLSYSWKINLQNRAVKLTAEENVRFQSLQKSISKLKGPVARISGSKLLRGQRHKLTLCVRNIVGLTSCSDHHFKLEEENKLQFSLGAKTRVVKVAADVKEGPQRRPYVPGCNGKMLSDKSFLYIWSINDSTVNLVNKNHRFVRVKKGSLKPGQTYNVTLMVMLVDNPKVKAMRTIQWITTGSNLKAIIKGGKHRTVRCHSMLLLDASLSQDPDRIKEAESYEWDCLETNGKPCQINRTKTGQPVLEGKKRLMINTGSMLPCNNRKGTRWSESRLIVRVLESQIADVELKSEETRNKKYLVISCKFKSTSSAKLTWISNEVDGAMPLDLNDTSMVVTKEKNRFFKKPGYLRMVHRSAKLVINLTESLFGYDINIGCQVENRGGRAWASLNFRPHTPPFAGNFVVSPLVGDGMLTNFSLFAEDWEASEEDDQLIYTFGYMWPKDNVCKKFQKIILISNADTNFVDDVQLPPGCRSKAFNLTLFVTAKDSQGASTTKYTMITVKHKHVEIQDLINQTRDNQLLLEDRDFDAATGQMIKMLHYLESKDTKFSVSKAHKQEINKHATKVITTVLQQGSDDNSISSALQLGTLATAQARENEITDPKATERLAQAVLNSVKSDAVNFREETPIKKSIKHFRGRRDISGQQSDLDVDDDDLEGMSINEAEQITHIFENIINETEFDELQDRLKSNFSSAMVYIFRLMCSYVLDQETYRGIKTRLGVMTVALKSGEDLSSIVHSLGDNGFRTEKTATVLFGKELKQIFHQWNCTLEDHLCSDVCVAGGQYPHDIFSREDNDSRVSDVVSVTFFNPETHNPLRCSYRKNLIQYQLPLYDTVKDGDKLECHSWNKDSAAWTPSNCSTSIDFQRKKTYCNCSSLGQVTVFKRTEKANVIVEPGIVIQTKEVTIDEVDQTTTQATAVTTATTKPSTSKIMTSDGATISSNQKTLLTTANPTQEYLEGHFKLPYDYDTYVASAKLSVLQNEVITKMAKLTEIPQSHIEGVTFTEGSIIVNFKVIKFRHNSTLNLTEVVMKLQQVVNAGKLVLTFKGDMLTVESTSMQLIVSTLSATTIATKATERPRVKGAGLTLGKIMLIIVSICVFTSLMCVIARYFLAKKAIKTKVLPDRPWTPMDDLQKGTLVHVSSINLGEEDESPRPEVPCRVPSWASLSNPYYAARVQLHGIGGKEESGI